MNGNREDGFKMKPPCPWVPTTDILELKVLGKFLEELGECINATARVLVQGIDEKEPTTGKVNREWLENEIADVRAGIQIMVEYYNLDEGRMCNRQSIKYAHKKAWHKL